MILLSSKVNIVIITKTYHITKSNNNSNNNNKNKNKWTYHRQKDILTFLIHLTCFYIFKKHI